MEIYNEEATLIPQDEENIAPDTEATKPNSASDGEIKCDTERVDYESLERSDVAELKEAFPELSQASSLSVLKNPLRYGALRDLGLTPIEAYLASEGIKPRPVYNNRSHLCGSVPAQSYGNYLGMSRAELDDAKQIFGDLSDHEIQRLYKKVTR